ncbi:hypothetical protein WMY93_023688 [Mugilogobius chulae]|uniref:Nucleosome assembly protein 1-like 4 n=1 Tax=Mugilogobius chulae TaxID=88201 RepID=A0AAW0N9F4_9GOBI
MEIILPKAVKRRVHALKRLQVQCANIEAKFYEEVHELERKYSALYQPLFDKRRDIVTGTVEPTDEECEWQSDRDEEDELAEHDEPILKHLKDIQVKFSEPGQPMSFTLEFHFEPNGYFNNAVLTKVYKMKSEPDESEPFSFEGPEIVDCEGCQIDWHKGKDVTVKTIKKKQKHKGRGTVRTVTKTVPNDSFFNFFNPAKASPDAEDDDSEFTLATLATDFEIGHFFRERIVPRAVLYFTGEADESFEEEEMEEGDEEEQDEEGDEDDDEGDFDPKVSAPFDPALFLVLALKAISSKPKNSPSRPSANSSNRIGGSVFLNHLQQSLLLLWEPASPSHTSAGDRATHLRLSRFVNELGVERDLNAAPCDFRVHIQAAHQPVVLFPTLLNATQGLSEQCLEYLRRLFTRACEWRAHDRAALVCPSARKRNAHSSCYLWIWTDCQRSSAPHHPSSGHCWKYAKFSRTLKEALGIDHSNQNELQEVAHLWNMHSIRHSRNAVAPSGRPLLMYTFQIFLEGKII